MSDTRNNRTRGTRSDQRMYAREDRAAGEFTDETQKQGFVNGEVWRKDGAE